MSELDKQVRLAVNQDIKDRLKVIQEYHGISNQSDAIRLAISIEYYRIIKEQAELEKNS